MCEVSNTGTYYYNGTIEVGPNYTQVPSNFILFSNLECMHPYVRGLVAVASDTVTVGCLFMFRSQSKIAYGSKVGNISIGQC